MLIADVDERAAGWIYTALNDLQRRMNLNGHTPPAGVEEFAAWCLQRARRGQPGSSLADLDGLADDARMTRAALTIDEAAGVLNVSRSSVKRLVSSGDLATVSIAGTVRIRRTDLDDYLASRKPIDRSSAA